MELTITKDKQDLERLEGVIQKNIGAFYEVGRALMTIRDDRLYEKVRGISTFETYCKQRWDFNRSHAYRLMDSAKVVEILSPIGDIQPVTESQARPLSRLEPQQQREAWQRAVDTAPEGKVTAAHVYKIVKGMTNQEQPAPQKPKLNQPIIKQELISDEFQSAFDMMVIEIKNARAMRWTTTSHKGAIELMKILLDIAEQ